MRPALQLVAVILAACGSSRTPTVAPVGDTPPTAPASSRLTPPEELHVPELDEYRKRNASMLGDRVYIIGRSEQRLAYVSEPADEDCGCYTLAVIVLDLATGAQVWSDRYESGELERKLPGQMRDLDEVWRARGAAWEQLIRELGIVREPAGTLATIATRGSKFPRVEIITEDIGADSPEGYAHLTRYRIDAVSTNRTTIAEGSGSSVIDLLEVRVPGYLAPRGNGPAAVLILERRRGWEGLPHMARLRFVGADLR